MFELSFDIILIPFVRHIICLSFLRFRGRWGFDRLAAASDHRHNTCEHNASDAFVSIACNLCDLLKVDL